MPASRFLPWLICLLGVAAHCDAAVHHAIEATLDPARGHIEVTDTVSVSGNAARELEFTLHPGLAPVLQSPGGVLSVIDAAVPASAPAQGSAADDGVIEPQHYRVTLPAGRNGFTLRYQGSIRHALQTGGEEYARQFSETPGSIAPDGVFLSGRSVWYPQFGDELLSFELTLHLPPGWYGMSQDERVLHDDATHQVTEQWRCEQPQQEIYLVAGPLTEYTQDAGGVQAMVLLHGPDPALAQQYLDATVEYLRLYSELIGPYPYAKFALVENFWETGYGMPSFTLLGPKVIRFPFILHSSYPHEILHNWWGNGVYVDYAHGNWSEGLTSYLADHLIEEQRGKGAEYRRGILQKYTDYVGRQRDFPLTDFRSRHSAVTESVGYGKTLMLFHMLRRELGDAPFIEGLRALYRQQRFRITAFSDVQQVFGTAAGKSLDEFFTQWVQRSGAPELRLSQAQAVANGGGFRLAALLEQVQDDAPYALQVPLVIRLQGRPQAWETVVKTTGRATPVDLELPARPLDIEVDPRFDVFRRLDRNEIPPAISQALGAGRLLIVLPDTAPAALRQAYATLASDWQHSRDTEVEVTGDGALAQLPDDRSVWLFGAENRFRAQLGRVLADYDYADRDGGLHIAGTELGVAGHSFVVIGRHSANAAHALGWLAADRAEALPGLGRKLPHYGKYSYLAFTGTAPDNVLKGQWPVVHSPLSMQVPQDDGVQVEPGAVELAPRAPLVAAPAEFSATRMQHDIAVLADASMQGRGLGSAALARAGAYIATQLQAAGLQPGAAAGNAWRQVWTQQVARPGDAVSLTNIIGMLPGTDPARTRECLVIGAHYDHLGLGETAGRAEDRGRIHPGADDNASGVAVLLELARALAGKPQPRSLVFVAFTGEESGRLGSRYFVQHSGNCTLDGMIAMLNLDTVGRLGERPLLALGTGSAPDWVHILQGAGYLTGVDVKAVANDIGASDQASFIEAGVPAIQLFSGAHADFHRPGDTVDKIDAAGLVKTAQVLKQAVIYLAGRAEPLADRPGRVPRSQDSASAPAALRRVSLGIVPDYAAAADGVRVAEVREGTAAMQAGLQSGDLITALNGTLVHDLRDYSRVLRELAPGDTVEVTVTRNATQVRVSVRAGAR